MSSLGGKVPSKVQSDSGFCTGKLGWKRTWMPLVVPSKPVRPVVLWYSPPGPNSPTA